jgi:2-oxoisovalerate dehydrogenase E2 component (dihydrolipoyl transacylase)
MAEQAIRLPDVGEGVAEAELVEWHVRIGEIIQEDAILAAVMTDKATVEIPSPIAGEVVWLAAEVGDVLAVGSDLVRVKTQGAADGARAPEAKPLAASPAVLPTNASGGGSDTIAPITTIQVTPSAPDTPAQNATSRPFSLHAPRPEGERPLASPAVRRRAQEAGMDLRQVPGTTGPG